MRAIETNYNGITFRSKTEAKWAMFMDMISCPYVYEPQAFDLGEHGCYLPDFWLPDADCFVEIKPESFVDGRQSPTKALCAFTQKKVITFCGQPTNPMDEWREDGYADIWDWDPRQAIKEGAVGWDNFYWFCICPKCRRVGIEFNGRADRIRCNCPKSDHGDKGYNYDDPVLVMAYAKTQNAFRWTPKI